MTVGVDLSAAQPLPRKRLPPHPALREHYADEAGRLAQVRRWFDSSAGHYDRVNALMSFGSGVSYRSQALRRFGLQAGDRLLDCGSGTGVIAAIAQDLVGASGLVVALDPSSGMLSQARGRGVRNLVPGRAECLPFADSSFDRLTMGYALRHVADLGATFSEYRRVLAPGGSLLLLEITRPGNRGGSAALRFYMRTLVPLATRLFRHGRDTAALMRYYWDTIEHCVPPATILAALRGAGFEQVSRQAKFGVFSEYTAMKPRQDTEDSTET
jgi:demethylmenaquinone methyltransferase / 2-methoxy-6-polyprenyl-1,4-benzoquinol methylase